MSGRVAEGRRRFRLGGREGMLLLMLAGLPPDPAAAQVEPVDTQRIVLSWTSPLLPDRHWAIDALWKAESLGLLPGFLPAQRAVPRYTAGIALLRALQAAEVTGSPIAPLTRAWYARFVEEFPELQDRLAGAAPDAPLEVLGASVSGGFEHWRGRVAPGVAQFPPDRTGAIPLATADDPTAAARVAIASGRYLTAELAPEVRQGDFTMRAAEVAAGWGHWMLSVGRRPVAYTMDGEEGVVLSGQVPLDRIQLETRSALHPRGWFRHLGPTSFSTFFGVLPEERHPGRPYFWGARVALQPHPRASLTVQRAAMFGGDGSELPITARHLLQMLVGSIRGGAFEDQIVSVAGRWRIPSEALLPLTATLEWGAEDGAGAWRDVPGQVWGLRAPALPVLPQVGVGLEYARFGGACCGNPPWYRHFGFPGAWAAAERPLGHRLGGQGHEVRLRSDAELLDGRLRLRADGFRRSRSGDNLFVPGREGASTGLLAEASWRVAVPADLELRLARERGDGWAERRLEIGGTLFVGIP